VQNDNFDDPAGPTYDLAFSYDTPDPATALPPGMRPFGGVGIVYESDDGTRWQGQKLYVDHPEDWISPDFPAVGAGHFKVWFVSFDVDGNVNTIVPGVTPMIDVTVVYPPAGQGSAPSVTGFTLSNSRFEAQPDGTLYAMADLAWVNPTSPRYALTTFYRVSPLPVRQLAIANDPLASYTLRIIDWPTTPTDWVIAAIPSDFDGNAAADPNAALPGYIPTVTWHLGPPGSGGTGSEVTSALIGVSGVTITTEQQVSSDGIQMMRHKIAGWTNPTDNSFGGASIARVVAGDTVNPVYWDAAKGATSITTPWEPASAAVSWDFYFVSRDMQGHRNTILRGFTPAVLNVAFVPTPGQLLSSRMPKDWFNTSEFTWPAGPGGLFTAASFVAQKIFVGSILRVGGGTAGNAASFGGNQNGQIAVYNASNVLRAWIGQQDTPGNGTPGGDNPAHTVFGGWFAELYVGGNGPPTAPFYTSQDGRVIVGGFTQGGGFYPYISIRNSSNVEVGRMGAQVGFGGTGPESSIHGAWFQEFAYGGTNLSDWRMLAKMDATVPNGASVTMRNINLFSIDYMQNYPTPSNFNAAMHLEFGFGSFVIPGAMNYKFPGLSLVRGSPGALTHHGIALINRGLILSGPNQASKGYYTLGSFVTYNGDNTGADGGNYWCVLSMTNYTNGNQNVNISSGTASSNSASMYLQDGAGNTLFQVADNIPVICRMGVDTLFGHMLTSAGQFVGASINLAANGFLQVNNANVIQIISGVPQFTGAGGVNTSGSVWAGGDIRAPNYFVGVGAGATLGATGSFTTANGKTVTVQGGIITSIV